MNYLAHTFLSFGYGDVMIGNFIADALRGKETEKYNATVNNGFLLHRAIDNFTDHHPIVKQSKQRLDSKYGKYDAVVIDILYDYLLANNWSLYATITLELHAQKVYDAIECQLDIMPAKVQQSFPYIKAQNWLVNYGNYDGISESLNSMARRATFDSHMDEAIVDLKQHRSLLQQDFNAFFPEMISFAKLFLKNF